MSFYVVFEPKFEIKRSIITSSSPSDKIYRSSDQMKKIKTSTPKRKDGQHIKYLPSDTRNVAWIYSVH